MFFLFLHCNRTSVNQTMGGGTLKTFLQSSFVEVLSLFSYSNLFQVAVACFRKRKTSQLPCIRGSFKEKPTRSLSI